MGKTGKWLKSILTGKKDNNNNNNKEKSHHQIIISSLSNDNNNTNTNPATTPISSTPMPKEKRRWSFRRSSKDSGPAEPSLPTPSPPPPPPPHAMRLVADAEAAAAAARAAAVVIRLTAAAAAEEAAAVKIQSVFRSYLARKALCALKGLVKLQALVRGHLVRKQATATLRCMQALVTAQERARAHRIRACDDGGLVNHRTSTHRKSLQDNNWLRNPYQYDFDMGNMEENIKIVEMDKGTTTTTTSVKSRNSYSNNPTQPDHHPPRPPSSGGARHRSSSAARSSPALTDTSPRACSGHFEEYCSSFGTAQSSPWAASKPTEPDYDFRLCPSYMANTLSSRAKARSQSAPRQRSSFDGTPPQHQPGRPRRASANGVPRAVRMQRCSSHVGLGPGPGQGPHQQHYYPWSMVRLDRSTVSLKDSECGSTSTVLTNTNYCRSLVAFDVHGNRY